MATQSDIAYIAGLFDGEGSIYFAKRPEKKKKHKGKGYRISNSQRISMEISMTDKSKITDELNGWEVLPKRLRKWAMKIK